MFGVTKFFLLFFLCVSNNDITCIILNFLLAGVVGGNEKCLPNKKNVNAL